jgi:hypothetical protein
LGFDEGSMFFGKGQIEVLISFLGLSDNFWGSKIV